MCLRCICDMMQHSNMGSVFVMKCQRMCLRCICDMRQYSNMGNVFLIKCKRMRLRYTCDMTYAYIGNLLCIKYKRMCLRYTCDMPHSHMGNGFRMKHQWTHSLVLENVFQVHTSDRMKEQRRDHMGVIKITFSCSLLPPLSLPLPLFCFHSLPIRLPSPSLPPSLTPTLPCDRVSTRCQELSTKEPCMPIGWLELVGSIKL